MTQLRSAMVPTSTTTRTGLPDGGGAFIWLLLLLLLLLLSAPCCCCCCCCRGCPGVNQGIEMQQLLLLDVRIAHATLPLCRSGNSKGATSVRAVGLRLWMLVLMRRRRLP
jgi:hypothetical protein